MRGPPPPKRTPNEVLLADRAGAGAPPILDARISGDGRTVGFVWDRELYAVATDCA